MPQCHTEHAASLSDEYEPPDVIGESDDDPCNARFERPTDRPFDDSSDWPAGASSPPPPTSSASGIPVCSPFPAVADWLGGGTPVTTSCAFSPVLFKPRLEPRLEPCALPSLSGSMIESGIV